MRMTSILAAGIALAGAMPALAQADAKNNSAIKTAHTVNDGGPSRGANSFTQAQAREHIAKSGYDHVSALSKDDQGVWRGTAHKNGRVVHVGLDFKGNVSTDS